MSEPDIRPIIQEFLETQSTLALSTVNATGEPETAPVFYVSDDRFNLYWLSATHVHHSVNIAARPQVSGCIYPTIWEWQEIVGIQMRGAASVISDERLREQILLVYLRKFKLPPAFDAAIAASTLYQLQPSWIRWVNNSVKFGYKAELDLTQP